MTFSLEGHCPRVSEGVCQIASPVPAFAGMTRAAVRATTRDGDAPCRAPALDSRFRGNDDEGCAGRQGLLVAEVVPLSRDGRFAKRPYDGVWGCWGNDGG